MEAEKRKRDAEREERQKKDKQLKQSKTFLEAIKETAGKGAQTIKVDGKALNEIAEADLQSMDMSKLEKARLETVRKGREVTLRQRKAEAKRVDHLARAFHEEEVALLPGWKVKKVEQVTEQMKAVKQNKLQDMKHKHERSIDAKKYLAAFVEQKA